MTTFFFLIGVVLAVALLVGSATVPQPALQKLARVAALVVFLVALLLSTVVYVGADETGIVVKNAMGASLKDGRLIATSGEMGVQAEVLRPGWHFGYWPVVYNVRTSPLVEIKSDEIGLIEARDGLPLDSGQLFAPEFAAGEFQSMLEAGHFLGAGKGRKGAQSSVLTPGKYPLNTELFKITTIKQTEIKSGEVGVIKANFGLPASLVVEGIAGERPVSDAEGALRLADAGEMGIRARVLGPGKYPLNTSAYSLVEIWTTQMISHYAAGHSFNPTSDTAGKAQQEEQEITVRTSDGFTFPVDVRIEYHIKPENAPTVVAKLGDDEGERFRNALNSAVRATFRNNAEKVRALDYVQQRSHQESQSLAMLTETMAHFGVTVTAVRIGNVGDERTLGALLKTQTDREIAKQEQLTFQEQQKAAEQKKQLARTVQEADEEKRLATANYEVKIGQQQKERRVIEAGAEAEAILIKANAQAQAFEAIAKPIGRANAAMIEALKVIGEQKIEITPRVMIAGPNAGDGTGVALMGTMLQGMIARQDETPEKKKP